MAFMKKGGKLKTTGNARKLVSGKPASVKVPGLPRIGGLHEASGASKMGTRKPKGMKVSANMGSKY